MKVLALNGPVTGIVERPEQFNQEEKQQIEEMKGRLEFVIDDVEYAGVCRECGRYIKKQLGYYHLSNKDGRGTIAVDVYHKWCH